MSDEENDGISEHRSHADRVQLGMPRSLTECLAPYCPAEFLGELERYRIEYEHREGKPTEVSNSYTSLLRPEVQYYLLSNYPEQYIAGLPPFMKECFEIELKRLSTEGGMDDLPDGLLRGLLRRSAGRNRGDNTGRG